MPGGDSACGVGAEQRIYAAALQMARAAAVKEVLGHKDHALRLYRQGQLLCEALLLLALATADNPPGALPTPQPGQPGLGGSGALPPVAGAAAV